MLIYDANKKVSNPKEALPMEAYMKGVYDSAEFKEEDHPRGGKGSEGGGRFVKSEKTKQKEDDVDDLGTNKEGKPKQKTEKQDVKTLCAKAKSEFEKNDKEASSTFTEEQGKQWDEVVSHFGKDLGKYAGGEDELFGIQNDLGIYNSMNSRFKRIKSGQPVYL